MSFLCIEEFPQKKDLSDYTKLLVLKLFEDCNYDMAIRTLLKTLKQYCYTADLNNISLISGLHCASDSGISVITARLEEVEGCDTNQVNCAGNRPLAWPLENRTGEQEKVTRDSGVLPHSW